MAGVVCVNSLDKINILKKMKSQRRCGHKEWKVQVLHFSPRMQLSFPQALQIITNVNERSLGGG